MATFTHADLIAWTEETQSSGKERLRPWQRDALRRILQQGALSPDDIDDLAALATDSHAKPSKLTAEVATTAHVTPSSDSLPAVSLTAVRNIARVNALGEGPVQFDAAGLTVVYGENASGKSGVARILKKACRARVAGNRIRPNVYKPEPTEPAAATIDFEIDGAADHASWVDGENAGDALATVTVFDASCAEHQVQRDQALTYTPEVLTVFRELASVCDRVRMKLEAKRGAMGSMPASIAALKSELGTETAAGRFLNRLSAATTPASLNAIANLTEAETAHLNELRNALRVDPLAAAAEVEAQSRRIEALDARLSQARSLVTDDALNALATQASEASSSAEAARAAREAFAEHSELDGIGGESWRRLWEAAREYSNLEAYPSETFPVTRDGAICILCQQPVADAAKHRLHSFEEFVTAEVQQISDKAASELTTAVSRFRSLEVPRRSRDAVVDVGLQDAEEGPRLRRLIAVVKRRRLEGLRVSSGKARTSVPDLPELPDLSRVRARLATRIENLRTAAADDGRRAMEAERDELGAREKLAPQCAALADEISRLKNYADLNDVIAECTTTGITRKQGEAEKAIVSGRFKAKFRHNLNNLGFSEIPVDIEAGIGAQGTRPYGVRLTANPGVPAHEVLSEGEATCVALAGVLSELDITENRSALVLDDPVSSLDHNYRERVALRLCEEAKNRQVVVFTHDPIFLFMLDKYASSLTVPQRQVSLIRGGTEGGHGCAEQEPPWITMKVNDRITRLRRELVPARQLQKAGDQPGYEREASRIYDNLRKTWERAVEEVLLNGTILRFGDSVQTQRLRAVADDLPLEDIEEVDTQMAYCSGFAHDRACAAPSRPPGPDIVEDDIRKLDEWVKQLRNRRKKK